MNPVDDRELDLRGLRVGAIENLAVLNDGFGCLDLCDNAITALADLPRAPRLRALLLANNRVARVEPGVGAAAPGLTTLVLTNNRVASLADVAALGSFKSLESLSLLGNPVTRKAGYRLLAVHACPRLRLLDFARVRAAERAAADALFKSKAGRAILKGLKDELARDAAAGASGGGGGGGGGGGSGGGGGGAGAGAGGDGGGGGGGGAGAAPPAASAEDAALLERVLRGASAETVAALQAAHAAGTLHEALAALGAGGGGGGGRGGAGGGAAA